MSLIDILLPEYDRETSTTRQVLERVPDEALGWTPHETAMALDSLASHVAMVPTWTSLVMTQNSLDKSAEQAAFPHHQSRRLVWSVALTGMSAARDLYLVGKSDDELTKSWTLQRGSKIIFSLPKIAALRYFVVNNLIHHHGEICVYLSMLNVAVPSIYSLSVFDQQ